MHDFLLYRISPSIGACLRVGADDDVIIDDDYHTMFCPQNFCHIPVLWVIVIGNHHNTVVANNDSPWTCSGLPLLASVCLTGESTIVMVEVPPEKVYGETFMFPLHFFHAKKKL